MAMDTTVLDTATFAIKKRIRMAIFLVLLSVAALREQITRLLKVFWQVLGKLKGHYFNSQEVDGSKFFQNKGYLPGEKKGIFLLILLNVTDIE